MLACASLALGQVGQPKQLATGVFFREGDVKKGHCNLGWVLFNDYALIIDANFPEAATEALAQAKSAAGNKPLRFLFNTSADEDHAFGNEVWGAQGATIIASDECAKALATRGPTQFAALSTARPDVKASKLRLPQMTFDQKLVLDDGATRVELTALIPAAQHPAGAVAWLPKAKVLFTGDLCVNGPFNNLTDANLDGWLAALDRLLKLDIAIVAPGHGPSGDKKLLEGQRDFLLELRKQVQVGVAAKKKLDEIKADVKITDARLANWVGPGLPIQIEAVFKAVTAKAVAPPKSDSKKPTEAKPAAPPVGNKPVPVKDAAPPVRKKLP